MDKRLGFIAVLMLSTAPLVAALPAAAQDERGEGSRMQDKGPSADRPPARERDFRSKPE